MDTVYLEYKILKNRPGLLGNVASLLGLLNINILTIASIENRYRGLLIEIKGEKDREILQKTLDNVDELQISSLRKPQFFDILALKHGKKIETRKKGNSYIFIREDLDLLIDFLGEFLKRNRTPLIGFKGSPRVGKTETAIAAVVHANKYWQLLSTTLLRKITRTKIAEEYLDTETVFIIDAITTFQRSTAEHIRFIRKIIKKEVPRIIEHPEIFIRETNFKWSDFDLLLVLKDEENSSQENTQNYYPGSFSSFDIG